MLFEEGAIGRDGGVGGMGPSSRGFAMLDAIASIHIELAVSPETAVANTPFISRVFGPPAKGPERIFEAFASIAVRFVQARNA